MGLVAGLDVRSGAVRAWVTDSESPDQVLSSVVGVPVGPDAEGACREALAGAVLAAGRRGADYLGITVCADAGAVPEHDGLSSPDELVARLCGVRAAEVSQACRTGLVDVARRAWDPARVIARRLPGRLAPLVEAGTVVGELHEGWPLPATLPVVSGSGGVQLVAMGCGGMGDDVTVVAGWGGEPVHVQAAVADSRLADPSGVRVLTHATPALWAVEPLDARNAEGPGELARAGVADVERALGRAAAAVVLWTPAGTAGAMARRVAHHLERPVHLSRCADPVATAGTVLVRRAVGAHAHVPPLPPAAVG